jgi:hypothetical protein
MPRFIALFFISLPACFSAYPAARAADAPASAAAKPWGRVTGDDLYVRSGPSQNHRDMGTLGADAIVRILDVTPDGEWLRIPPPKEGIVWISAKYIKIAGATGTVTGNNVLVRVRPVNGEEVDRLNRGATVLVRGRKDDWLKIAPPPSAKAWVHAQFVERMTADQLAAYKQKKAEAARAEAERIRREEEARRRAEAERRRREAEKRRREQERLAMLRREAERSAREAKLIGDADAALLAAVRTELAKRSLGTARNAYAAAAKEVRDPKLKEKAARAGAVLAAMANIQAALENKAFPRPLPGAEVDAFLAGLGVKSAADELRSAHRLATQRARAEQERRAAAAREPKPERIVGWLSEAGVGEAAAFRLVRNGATVARVRSEGASLAALIGFRVRLTGKRAGDLGAVDDGAPLFLASRAEAFFE